MGKVKLGVKIVRGLNNISHAVGKHSPLILTAAGVVGLGATAVFSYKAAKKMEVVVEEMEEARVIEEKIAALTPPADLEEMEELAELQGLMEVTAIDRVEIGKKVIGVDTDQAYVSEKVLTSAMKGLSEAVTSALEVYSENKWEEIGGTDYNLGLDSVLGSVANKDYVGIPTADASWRFKTFTKAAYETVLGKIKSGNIQISGDTSKAPTVENVTVTYVSEFTGSSN